MPLLVYYISPSVPIITTARPFGTHASSAMHNYTASHVIEGVCNETMGSCNAGLSRSCVVIILANLSDLALDPGSLIRKAMHKQHSLGSFYLKF